MSTNIQKQMEEVKMFTDKEISEFESQKENIQKIQSYEWFKYIQQFWIRKEMEAIKAFQKVDPENKYEVADIKAKLNLAMEFNSFINVRLR